MLIDFAVVIIINLVISLFCALFFIPAMMHKLKFTKNTSPQQIRRKRRIVLVSYIYSSIIQFIIRFRWLVVVVFILLFGLPFYMLPKYIYHDGLLAKIYNKTIGNEFFFDNIKPLIDKTTGGTLRLFNMYVYESEWYNNENTETILYVRIYILTDARMPCVCEPVYGSRKQ